MTRNSAARRTGSDVISADVSVFDMRTASPEDQKQIRLSEVQEQEEDLIDKYNLVLDSLNTIYSNLEEKYMSSEPDLFKDRIMRGLMAEVRQYIRSNETHLSDSRRELWLGYDDELDVILENGMKR